jgi:hypothetical protein
MATAIGYWMGGPSPDRASPRKDTPPRQLDFAHGYCNGLLNFESAYTNQDFYVYLLRIGTLDNFRIHLEALGSATIQNGDNMGTILAAYGQQLDATPTGLAPSLGADFSQTFAWYAADRAYIHSENARFRPASEPVRDYVLDTTLFSQGNLTLTNKDCTVNDTSVKCTAELFAKYPLETSVVSVDLSSLLPQELTGKPLTAHLSAVVSSGKVNFTAFGEKDGQGSASATVQSPGGGEVTLKNVGTDWPVVRVVVVPAGVPSADVTVSMSFDVPPTQWLLCRFPGTVLFNEAPYYGFMCIPSEGKYASSDGVQSCIATWHALDNYDNGKLSLTTYETFETKSECTAACIASQGPGTNNSCYVGRLPS